MVKKSLTECERENGIAGSRGSSVKGILFFLFAFAVCFGYFYFFTDVLRSKEETPGQPDVYTSEVKKPLPERLVQSAATSGEEAVLPPPVSSPLPEATSPITVATDLPVSPGVAKKAQQKVKSLPEAAKPKAAPQRISKTKTVTSGKSMKSVKTPIAQKKVPAMDKAGSSRTSAGRQVGAQFTLVVGTYVLKSSIAADKLKLEKAGLQASVMPAKIRNEPMNRLLVAVVSSSQAAQEELTKVKKANKDAFFLRENGKYAIYAGSYFAHDRAMQEQEHLRKMGFAPILKISQAPVPTYSLTSGSYSTRAEAVKGAERLKKLGFKPFAVELTK